MFVACRALFAPAARRARTAAAAARKKRASVAATAAKAQRTAKRSSAPSKPRTLQAFGLFMKLTAKNPMLRSLPIPKRGRALGKIWRGLPAAQKLALQTKARTIIVPPKPPKIRMPRKPSPFAKFVKLNYNTVRHLPFKQRLRVLAKQWHLRK